MSGSIPFCKIGQYLPMLKSINDFVRFVNPEKKVVVSLQEIGFVETGEHCFEHWCQKNSCENCVSLNAHWEHRRVVKIVDNSDAVTMVTALPITGTENPLVVELLNDITTSLIYNSVGNSNVEQNLQSLLNLNDMAIKDKLTSLYNRRYIDDRIPVDLQNASEGAFPITVLFIDIDDFKRINDKYGHDVGDIALQKSAEILNSVVRAGLDWAARYGGDEFLVCLNHADKNNARIISERICANIEKINIPVDGEPLHITVSIGAYTMKGESLSAAEIIKIADQNMFKSKTEGKNKITISST